MMKKFGLSMMIALIPAWLCSMDNDKRIGKILHEISEDNLEVLTQDPVPGDKVIVRYNHEYCWAQVERARCTEWQIIIKRNGSKAHGLLVPLSRLYSLIDDNKK